MRIAIIDGAEVTACKKCSNFRKNGGAYCGLSGFDIENPEEVHEDCMGVEPEEEFDDDDNDLDEEDDDYPEYEENFDDED